MDDFKRRIEGWRGGGFTCPCCRKVPIKDSRKLARRRLRHYDYRKFLDQLEDWHDELEAPHRER